MFFKATRGVLGRSVNFSITSRFLLRRSVFPDFLSVTCDYGRNYKETLEDNKRVQHGKTPTWKEYNIKKVNMKKKQHEESATPKNCNMRRVHNENSAT